MRFYLFKDQENNIMKNEMNNPYENDNSSTDEVDSKIAHKKVLTFFNMIKALH